MKLKIIKKYFTLLEIVISIAILSLCFSLIGMKTQKAIYKHRYENNIKQFNHYTQFCKKMALSNQADVYLNLKEQNENIEIEMGTSETEGFFKNMKKTKDILKDINFLVNEEMINSLEIVFTSNGCVIPKIKIALRDKNRKFKPYKILKI